MKLKPLFQYAGGKTKLLKHYKNILPTTGFDTYIEPFFGGGSVFLWMKEQNPNLNFIVNDVNEEIMSIYRNIRDNCQLFCGCLQIWEDAYLSCPDKESRKVFFYQARDIYWKREENTLFNTDNSALLYFLMKTSFNGIWQTCQDSHGRFGTPFGFGNQKKSVFDYGLVKEWSKILQSVEIKTGDALLLDLAGKSAMIYLDPPYRSSFTTYGTGFDDNAQKRLIKICEQWKQEGNIVYLSNREANDNFFETLLPNSKIHKFPITYTAGRRKKTATGFEAKPAIELLIEI